MGTLEVKVLETTGGEKTKLNEKEFKNPLSSVLAGF